MTTPSHPSHPLPTHAPGALEVNELPETVHHLAVEVFNLTTKVEQLRRQLETCRAALAHDSQNARPEERARASAPHFTVASSTDSLELGLDSFPPERSQPPLAGSGAGENHIGGDGPAVEPNVEGATQETAGLPEGPRSPHVRSRHVKIAAGGLGAVGLATLLLVGLVQGDDRVVRVRDGTLAVAPLFSEALGVLASNPAWPPAVQDRSLSSVFWSGQATNDNTPSRLSVLRSAVGSAVIDRELVGRSNTFSVGTSVVFWTHVGGGRRGDTIRHVWFHNAEEVSVTVLPVEGPSWRTQSRHTLVPEAVGVWVVELQDGEGRTLASHQFRSEGLDQAAP